jgi:lysophospholipase L1-like esterase
MNEMVSLTLNGTTYDSFRDQRAILFEAQELTEEQKAQARANLGIELIEGVTDEDLVEAGYTAQDSDLMNSYIWIASKPDEPYYIVEGSDRLCTRKFQLSKVPRISYNTSLTTLNEVYVFSSGTIAGIYSLDEVYDATADLMFDEIAFNFSWGGPLTADELNLKLAYANVETSSFYKKVLVLGDSISTDYYGDYTKWVTLLRESGFFPTSTVNDSIHATGFVARYNNEENDFITRIAAVENKSDFDLVVIFGGINDYIQGIPMGETDGDILTYFKPAVDYFFNYLVNNFTQARIVVLSPLRTYNIYNNTAGHHQTEYAAYIREVAKNYCLPVLNLTEESGFYPFNDTFREMWTLVPEGYGADGVHPNFAYQEKFLAPMIKNFLKQFL